MDERKAVVIEGSHSIMTNTLSRGFKKYVKNSKCGKAYIFNHLKFDYNLRLENNDSVHETEILKNAFTFLDFEVTTFTDFTHKQMRDQIIERRFSCSLSFSQISSAYFLFSG